MSNEVPRHEQRSLSGRDEVISNTETMLEKLGAPTVSLETMMGWISHWIQAGGRLLNKHTHFENHDGRY
jgi:hypothetical protein